MATDDDNAAFIRQFAKGNLRDGMEWGVRRDMMIVVQYE